MQGHKPSSEIELEMTNVNNAGTWELVLSRIQLYGWVFERSKTSNMFTKRKDFACGATIRVLKLTCK